MADDGDDRNANPLMFNEGRGGSSSRPPPIEIPLVGLNDSNGPKTPTPGPGPSGAPTVARSKSDREKKIGHRRVKEGDVTYKKIHTSQIMGSIQLGVQHAIGGLASKPDRDILMPDFVTVEETYFPSNGSNHTQAHPYSDFRFKTYAPIAFRYFRDLFGIRPDDFLMSMCNVPMRELSNPGASGSIFYLTDDDEFIVKTVQLKECNFLQKLLPGYYMNLNQNPRTLLPKFFGLFCYQCNSKNVRLVVMNNLLPSSVKMHQKYDLKGSTYKRKASKQEQQKAYPTYKDLDFLDHHPEGLLLEADTCTALIKTMQRDCLVLESFKIMDYSLLVGIHNLDIAAKEKAQRASERGAKTLDSEDEDDEIGDFTPGSGLSRTRSVNRQKVVQHSTALESIQAESEPIDAEEDVPPGGIPARNAKGERLLLFLGLIDILQSYHLKKKLEHTFKAMIHDGDTVSVHRPGFYAERFMSFMMKSVFRKIPSPLKHSPSKKRPPPRLRASGEQMENSEVTAVGSPPLSWSSCLPSTSTTPSIPVANSTSNYNSNIYKRVLPPTSEEQQKKGNNVGRNNLTEGGGITSGGGGGGPVPEPIPTTGSNTTSYPAVLRTERGGTHNASTRAKVPPPVPPRTPKRVGTTEGLGPSKGYAHPEPPVPLTHSTLHINSKQYHQHPPENDGRLIRNSWNLSNSNSSRRPTSSGQSSSTFNHPPSSSEVETISASDVYVETRSTFRSSLSVASSSTTSGVSSGLGQGGRGPRSPPTTASDRTGSGTPTWTEEGTPEFTESSDSGDLGCPTTPVKGLGSGATITADGPVVDGSADENENEMTRL